MSRSLDTIRHHHTDYCGRNLTSSDFGSSDSQSQTVALTECGEKNLVTQSVAVKQQSGRSEAAKFAEERSPTGMACGTGGEEGVRSLQLGVVR